MKTEQIFVTCDECQTVIDDPRELRFGLAGKQFAVDLCEHHRAIFDTLISQYIRIAQPVRLNHYAIRKDAPKSKVQTETPVKAKPKRARKSRAKAVEAPTVQVPEAMTNE